MPPSFATPLPQSPRSPILQLPLPAPHQNLVLTGRSRAAWHTSFVIPQLNLLLDAGLFVSDKLRPKHVFLTHGHSDHTLVAFSFMRREDPPDVVCPWEMAGMLDDMVLAHTMLNLGGLVGTDDADKAGVAVDEEEEEEEFEGEGRGEQPTAATTKTTTTTTTDGKASLSTTNGASTVSASASSSSSSRAHRSKGEQAFLNTHITHGVSPGDTIPLRRLPHISATAFACDHTVPSLGYLFSRTSHRLAPQYTSLPGAELAALRRRGVELTVPHTVPIFAFLGDGTARTLAADPAWLASSEDDDDGSGNGSGRGGGGGVPLVITECSFLYEEHRAQADKTKHTIWSDLEPVVRRWPRTVFVLTHFSLRYSEQAVVAFFEGLEDCPENIVVWADPEA